MAIPLLASLRAEAGDRRCLTQKLAPVAVLWTDEYCVILLQHTSVIQLFWTHLVWKTPAMRACWMMLQQHESLWCPVVSPLWGL